MTSVNEERANVSFVQSCGRGLAPEVAVHFKARRCRLPPYSVDFVDGRNIPKAVIDGSGFDRPASSAHDVRIWRCFDRRKSQTSGFPQSMCVQRRGRAVG